MSNRTTAQVTTLRLPMYRYHEDPFPPLQRTGGNRVYPYPMQDDLTDDLIERDFTAVVLDNGLLRVTVLPDFGGHVLSVRDLRNDREVFHHNLPLKFGLIGLRGAWYSGGIEFNFPQVGHTVTTNDRLPYHLREEPDGSATLFVGTIEMLTRMAWTVGITLRPNDWRLHISISLFNRTPFWHRIYFWTCTGVPARDDFRFLLPATQVYSWWWGSRGVANFPFHEGQDLSRYVTHRRPTDLFARDLRADWFGCYYDDSDFGVLHHASRFDVHGRKLWTWGTAEDGLMWADLLSDQGEPYCEIQSGRFVHQGVHRLMPPRSVERWQESWSPVWGLGGVLHATDTLALNARKDGDALTLNLFALVPMERATVSVRQGNQIREQTAIALPAGEAQSLTVTLRDGSPVSVTVRDSDEIALQATLRVDGDAVHVSSDAPAPHTGLPDQLAEGTPTTPHAYLQKAREHEERNDLDAAAGCYHKALELDSQCVPAMNGLAQWHLKRGEIAAGQSWAQKALQADPQSEDALWWLGVAEWLNLGNGTESVPTPSSLPLSKGEKEGVPLAESALWALQRSPTYAHAAFALLGELALRRNNKKAALDFFARALERNPQDSKTLALAALAARRLGDAEQAQTLLKQCEQINPLEPLLWSERSLSRDAEVEKVWDPIFRCDGQLDLETVCDYEQVGAWNTVATLFGSTHPLRLYHTAFSWWQSGKIGEALSLVREASQSLPSSVFPHRHEDAQALQTALQIRPDDALARYLLGNYLASVGRWDEAVTHWTQSLHSHCRGGASVPAQQGAELQVLTQRNIGLAKWLKQRSADEALNAYGHAIDAAQLISHPSSLIAAVWRLWLERDHVLSALGRHDERVKAFDGTPDEVKAKPQVRARWAEACLRAGMAERTVELLSPADTGVRRTFKPWEGEVSLRQLWKEAHLQLGHKAITANDLATARTHFEAAASYPPHLNVGKPERTNDADALFWAGWCALGAGDQDAARRFLELAATEPQPPNASSAPFKARARQLLQTLESSQ